MEKRPVGPSYALRRQVGALPLLLCLSVPPAAALELTVDSQLDLRDATPGDGVCAAAGSFPFCTLRAAIEETNARFGADVIVLPAGRHVLTRAGIDEDAAADGDLDITDHLTIRGQGPDLTVVDGAGLDRVFHVPFDALGLEVTFESLTVTGGIAQHPSPPYPAKEAGGGLLVQGPATVYLTHTRFADNLAFTSGGGGAFLATRSIVISHSEVTRNQLDWTYPADRGAGLHFNAASDSELYVTHSTISANGCLGRSVIDCAGGISARQNDPLPTDGLFVYNSTISGNEGAGLQVVGTNVVIGLSTVYGNSGYGVYLGDGLSSVGMAAAQSSIFAHNGLADCEVNGTVWLFQGSSNLASDATCDLDTSAGDQIGDPMLHPLGSRTLTPTHHPRWGSPVVDTGTQIAGITDDQEGYPRPVDGELPTDNEADIGAIEVLPCVSAIDLVLADQTLSSGTHEACRDLIGGPDLLIDGQVVLAARDTVVLAEGFAVSTTSELVVENSREAGAPAP